MTQILDFWTANNGCLWLFLTLLLGCCRVRLTWGKDAEGKLRCTGADITSKEDSD